MGTVTMILNLVILLAAAWLFSLERAVLTFVAIYIAAFITNKVVIGLKQRKSVIIISNRATPIAQVLMRYVGHGATYSTVRVPIPCRINGSFTPSSN